ncbi:MAG: hypothetical protein PHQ54_02995 [Candidatus Omnitrophica bacterium]|nr:hypothetical protein [Candidatus Omnitrophota bacterium]
MNRRKRLFANRFHRQIFILVALAALLPMIITTIALYYLIFGITASEIGLPEIVAYYILPAAKKVTFIILIISPVVIAAILLISNRMTHSILGPYERIVRELDEHLQNKRKGPIKLRKSDKFSSLVEKINILLSKTGS